MRLQAPALPLFCRHAVAAADVFVFVWAAGTGFILIVVQIKVGSNATAATALLFFEKHYLCFTTNEHILTEHEIISSKGQA